MQMRLRQEVLTNVAFFVSQRIAIWVHHEIQLRRSCAGWGVFGFAQDTDALAPRLYD